jgi:AcrR family transcriptional regulator
MRVERGITARGKARHSGERLPAAERRAAVLKAALELFATTSYASATTAEIARAAGVSEPILYRHFASKRDLWLACLDAAWDDVREAIERKIAAMSDGTTVADEVRSPWESPRLAHLWLQGLAGAGDDVEIRENVGRHIREVHDAVADLLRAQQQMGGVAADRDAGVEAWVFVAGGLLRGVGDQLGGVITPADFAAIGRERGRWLSGRG